MELSETQLKQVLGQLGIGASVNRVQKPFLGVYENMAFPPYQFREYPKWITVRTDAGERQVLVQTQRDELAIRAEVPEAAKDDPVVAEKVRLAEALQKEQDARRKLELELAEVRAMVQALQEPEKSIQVNIDKIDSKLAPAAKK